MKRRQLFPVHGAGYQRRVLALAAGLQPGLNFVDVLHDPSCPKAHNAGADCRCTPGINVNGRRASVGEA